LGTRIAASRVQGCKGAKYCKKIIKFPSILTKNKRSI
jgi:hypothetical protein